MSLREKYSLSRYLRNFGVFIRFETIEIISSRMHTARIVLNYAFYYVAIILFILSLYYIVIGNHNDGRLLIFPGIFLARFKAKTYD